MSDLDGVRLPHQRMDESVHQQSGLPGPRAGDHHDIAVEGGLGQTTDLRVGERTELTHESPFAYEAGGFVGPVRRGAPATRSAREDGDRPLKIHNGHSSPQVG